MLDTGAKIDYNYVRSWVAPTFKRPGVESKRTAFLEAAPAGVSRPGLGNLSTPGAASRTAVLSRMRRKDGHSNFLQKQQATFRTRGAIQAPSRARRDEIIQPGDRGARSYILAYKKRS